MKNSLPKKGTYSGFYVHSKLICLLIDSFPLVLFLSSSQTGKAISSENENTSNRAEECIAERIEVFKSAFGETEEQLNQEKYVLSKSFFFSSIWVTGMFMKTHQLQILSGKKLKTADCFSSCACCSHGFLFVCDRDIVFFS